MKDCLIRTMLFCLYRAMRFLERHDTRAAALSADIPEGFRCRIMGCPSANAPAITMAKTKRGLRRIGRPRDMEEPADATIVFKNKNDALKIVLGLMGISQAYAEHAFYLRGNINETMQFVSWMELTEAYLFPRVMARRILREVPKKELPALAVYGGMIFDGRRRK